MPSPTPANDLVIQRPTEAAKQLILLFHGVGSQPQAMASLGERLALEFPSAVVVAVCGPQVSDSFKGYQWFSVTGIDDGNRPERVAAALTGFLAQVKAWQLETGLGAAATALVGFSQGAILSLEASKAVPSPAGRVVALGGRFASLPTVAPQDTTLHLLHGKEDRVMPYGLTVTAAHHLRDLGGDITAEVLPFIGHEIHPDLIELTATKLSTHIPNRVWTQAMADVAVAVSPAGSNQLQ